MSMLARIATRAPSRISTRAFSQSTRRFAAEAKASEPLKKGAKKDPELYVLLAIMTGAFGLAGFYFGQKPTSATSETSVAVADKSMPWNREGAGEGKYQYHPGGDKNAPPREAPSALNSVVVPNVTLPKARSPSHLKIYSFLEILGPG
ncbi:MAG: hypothetical protein M1834_009333 [Cirrosporium novae-zelandiae]|nr:MAG: hypothetical protein M1834_009333 [Cirrosporium novae-zelandiae]